MLEFTAMRSGASRYAPKRRLGKGALAALSLSGLLLLSACGSEHSDTAHPDSDPAASSASGAPSTEAAGPSADDIMFAQMMIPHHRQAVLMAELAAARASDPTVIQLADEIRAAQQPEIDLMTSWLVEWSAEVPQPGSDSGDHSGHGMAGMLSEDQLADLGAAEGADFDRLFAEGMIEHHAGAIDMARDVTASADARVAALAEEIIATQQQEIEQLQAFLGRK